MRDRTSCAISARSMRLLWPSLGSSEIFSENWNTTQDITLLSNLVALTSYYSFYFCCLWPRKESYFSYIHKTNFINWDTVLQCLKILYCDAKITGLKRHLQYKQGQAVWTNIAATDLTTLWEQLGTTHQELATFYMVQTLHYTAATVHKHITTCTTWGLPLGYTGIKLSSYTKVILRKIDSSYTTLKFCH